MNQTLLKTFLAQTYSLQQVRRRLRLLRNFLEAKLFKGGDFTKLQTNPYDQQWLQSLGDNFFQNFENEDVYQILSQLEQQINNIPPLTIFIPFDMPEEEILRLGAWLRQNINPNIVFELKLNPDLIGGCALSLKGVYRDYSLKVKIDQSKTAILESLKSYIK